MKIWKVENDYDVLGYFKDQKKALELLTEELKDNYKGELADQDITKAWEDYKTGNAKTLLDLLNDFCFYIEEIDVIE